jgi:transposase
MSRLSAEEKMTIEVLHQKEESGRAIARLLGVSEGAVRYHLRKAREGRAHEDGRRNKRFQAAEHAEAIDQWLKAHGQSGPERRAANVRELHEWLMAEHAYAGNYKSVWRFVRAHYPAPARRPYRRVELPPGAQAQVDWCERIVCIGGAPRTLFGFWMLLSHSRAEAVIWGCSMDQLHWQQAHNQAFRALGGVPATVRIDNLKTGMAAAGPQGRVNPAYQRYAQAAGFHVDACLVRHPEGKGKVESRIGRLATRLVAMRAGGFADLHELQRHTDEVLEEERAHRRCPATGSSVAQAWEAERALLRPPEMLPEVFEVVVTRTVQKDCLVQFEGRAYSVPFALAWQRVEVRGGAGVVSIWHEGREVARHARGTAERILLQAAHFEGPATATHQPPLPLGKVGSRILELARAPVQLRAIDYYEKLVGVAS